MKKTALFVVMMMAALSIMVEACCDSDSFKAEDFPYISGSSVEYKRSFEDALAIAQGSLSMLDAPVTRSGQIRKIDISDTQFILSSQTRSDGDADDTLLYVFNFANNGGFAVVSANATVSGLLAVTEAGNYNEETLKQNKGLAIFMEMAKEYSRFQGLIPLIDTLFIMVDYVDPLVEVNWGQRFPEGLYFPNTVAGCSNAATALVASYLEYPTHLNLTFYNADTTDVTLDWNAMKQHFSGSWSYISHSNSGCCASIEAHKNIGRLVRQIAIYNTSQLYYHNQPMSWNTPLPHTYYTYVEDPNMRTYTYTYTDRISRAFDSLGYSHTLPARYTARCTQNHLDNQKLVYMSGKAYSQVFGEYIHHSWVVDGYKDYIYEITDNSFVEPLVQTIYAYYNHINWGWDGNSNGYFNDGVFDVANAHSYDNSNHAYTYSFSDIWYWSVYR